MRIDCKGAIVIDYVYEPNTSTDNIERVRPNDSICVYTPGLLSQSITAYLHKR